MASRYLLISALFLSVSSIDSFVSTSPSRRSNIPTPKSMQIHQVIHSVRSRHISHSSTRRYVATGISTTTTGTASASLSNEDSSSRGNIFPSWFSRRSLSSLRSTMLSKSSSSVTLPATIMFTTYTFLHLFLKIFVKSGAPQRISSNLRFYMTIPLLAGIFNAITNRLAVWMMFQPIKFRGITLGGTKLGWQGIVPREVRRMGGDISDMITTELLNVSEILKQVDANKLAELLLNEKSSGSNSDESNDSKLITMCRNVLKRSLQQSSGSATSLTTTTRNMSDGAVDAVLSAFLTKDRMTRVIERVVREVQNDTDTCIDLRHAVVEAMAQNPKLIVNLFQQCGKDELKFMVTSGFYGGAFLGLFQMASYAIYPQAWTLVLGGALVGYMTDTLALQIMFAPIQPINVLGRKIQGLFLQRQDEVSADFGLFVSNEILNPSSLWDALLKGPRRNRFLEKVTDALLAEVPEPLLEMASPSFKDRIRNEIHMIADKGISEFASDTSYTEPTYQYVGKQLALESNIQNAMASLPSAKFERVLHPVFEQDEAVLIAVGSILGGLVGLAQAIVG